MIDMEAHLKELCNRIIPDLDNCTNQDKKDAYNYLELKVTATPEGVDIKGYLDPSTFKNENSCLITTGQTSGYLFVGNKSEPMRLVSILPLVRA
jgi:site-specific DNA recombinase